MTTTTRRRVVLHFDLNRTILMSDAAGGRTMENTVNYLLSECTWGYRHPQRPEQWVCVSERSSAEPPRPRTCDVQVGEEQVKGVPLITYKQFVDEALPYKSLAAAEAGSLEAVKAFNKAAKKQRTALQSAFTGENGPGARVVASFREVMDKLHFPVGAQRDAAKELAKSMAPSRLQEAWSEGRYYLLPSFMQFLAFLAGHRDRFDFKLVFRTFGDDIPEVAKEIQMLVDGTHPFCAEQQPLPAAFQLDATSSQVGTFYRNGFDASGTALAVGTLQKVPFTTQHQSGVDAVASFYREAQQDVRIVHGFDAVHAQIREMTESHATIALRDYWEWWSAHAEDGEYGKLLLVDTQPSDDEIAVFFDDHIEAHHAHIVDVRDVKTGAPVPFEVSRGKYLQRVEPFAAITDAHYFINLVSHLLQE
ncbi:hypothetical protein P43SY_010030 [Pythium insidiosum]|uniref:Uncharacterized protein n=1 Tax=Pythium insidiosum TaxID=114742 RepID=A0AAD5Q6R6_PYTIN|nr:hypothetical protein P43SY_010030 [Pythium insidiosum]